MDYQALLHKEKKNIENSVRLLAKAWTEYELEKGNYPSLEDFLEQHESFKDSEILVKAIGEEMFNAKEGNTLESIGRKHLSATS